MARKRKSFGETGYLSVVLSALLFSVGYVHAAEIITVESKASSARTVLGSTVIPYKEVTLSAQMPGRVEWINGEVGSMFHQGELLVKIDDDDLQAKRRSVMASLDSAQASLQNSQAQYTRELVSPRSKDISAMPGFALPAMMDIQLMRPFLGEMMSKNYDEDYNRYSDLISSSTGVSQAKSQVMQAWSQLGEIDAKLKDAVAIAPFDGMILEKMVEEGDTVQPGQPMLKYGFVKYKRLRADVPSILKENLYEGMIVPVVINGRVETKARISQIYPVADATRHTVTVKFDLYTNVNADPGMYAEIYLPDSNPDAESVLIIPRTALLKGRSLPSVLVLNDEGKSELRLVRIGSSQGDSQVSVTTGLKPGDRIIDNPPAGASSGYLPK